MASRGKIKITVKKINKFSYPGYPPEFDETFRRKVRKRDNYCCAICGRKERMDVHHIDYVKEHTTVLNCISLCRSCHLQLHRLSWIEKQDWKYKLWRLAGERERNNEQRTG